MFGKVRGDRVLARAKRALDQLSLQYEVQADDAIVLSAMGDDNPIGMVIVADDKNRTLNIYGYLMFDIPEEARSNLVPALNEVNNTINNGGFYMDTSAPKIYFKVVQSFFDRAPSVETIKHLIMISFQTIDVNDGRLKGLIPASAVIKDPMFS